MIEFLRTCKTERKREYCKGLRIQHIEKYKCARIAVNDFVQKSISSPAEVLSLKIDGMDNFKSLIPRIREKSKGLVMLHRLPSRITGVIVTSGLLEGNRSVKFFLNHGQSYENFRTHLTQTC